MSIVDKVVSSRGSLIWEEAGVPEENPRVQVDIYNLSYTVDKGNELGS